MKKGIDISKWQGVVDFAAVKHSGIEFVLMRSSYGSSIDERFLAYVSSCKKSGPPILGVYHFSYAMSVDQAVKEAEFCVKAIKTAGLPQGIMVFYDFEYDTVNYAKKHGVTLNKTLASKFATAFCNKIRALGYKPGVYTNIDYYKNWFDKSVFDGNLFWLADWTGQPDYKCDIHQWTDKGRVAGISGDVDMNKWYDDAETTAPKQDISEVAKDVIAGKYGNAPDRKAALEKAGYNYEAVQKEVNKLLSK